MKHLISAAARSVLAHLIERAVEGVAWTTETVLAEHARDMALDEVLDILERTGAVEPMEGGPDWLVFRVTAAAGIIGVGLSGEGEVTPTWPAHRVGRLILEWRAGTSTARIGRLLGTTKNGVVGKINRLAPYGVVVRRASPLPEGVAAARATGPSRAVRAAAVALPVLASEAAEPVLSVEPALTPIPRPPARAPPVLVPPVAPPLPPILKRTFAPARACQWPHGDPKHPDFGFCGAPVATPGRPYCEAHARLGVVRAHPRHTHEVAA